MAGNRQTRVLATWSDVRAHVATTYRDLVDDGDARCEFALVIPATPTAAGATVAMEARLFDPRWFAVTSVIGSMKLLSPKEQLANNVQSTIGMLCTRDGKLAIRQALPLGQLDPFDLDETVRALARATLFVRAKIHALDPG